MAHPAANAPVGEEPRPDSDTAVDLPPTVPTPADGRPADGSLVLPGEMEAVDLVPQRRQLHPLPPGLVELYGLLAVLFVLVPEWMAGGALLGLRLGRDDADLPVSSAAWQRLPELRLATLSLAELRRLARQEGLVGYGRMERERLSERLLLRLQRRSRPAKPL